MAGGRRLAAAALPRHPAATHAAGLPALEHRRGQRGAGVSEVCAGGGGHSTPTRYAAPQHSRWSARMGALTRGCSSSVFAAAEGGRGERSAPCLPRLTRTLRRSAGLLHCFNTPREVHWGRLGPERATLVRPFQLGGGTAQCPWALPAHAAWGRPSSPRCIPSSEGGRHQPAIGSNKCVRLASEHVSCGERQPGDAGCWVIEGQRMAEL